MNRTPLVILATTATALLLGCASPAKPRVTTVDLLTRDKTVTEGQARVFANSRAAGNRFVVMELPPEQQRQEILVRWAGTGIDAVSLEYRQPGQARPAQQRFEVAGRRTHLFVIGSEEFRRGGPVSAWRVTLWRAGQPVAHKQSMLWQ